MGWLLCACGGAPAAPAASAPPAPAPTTTATTAPPATAEAAIPVSPAAAVTSGFPVTIENCGNTLSFTQPPERVLVTYQNVAEILVALGLTDRIVGVTYGQAYDPPADYVAEVNGLKYLTPRGQGSAVKEVTLATQPDLVIAAYPAYDFDAAQGLATQQDFQAAGAQIFSMSVECGANPGSATIEDVYGDMLALGRIFGVEQRAQVLVERMRSRIDAVQQRVAERPAVPVAFYDAGEDQLGVYGSGLNADMIRLAGGENVFADQPEVYLQVSKEIFATRSPSIFAILDYEGNPAVPDEATRAAFLFTTFPNLPASQDQRWVAVSGAAFAAGVRIPDAVEQMARAFHPEAFE
jgi:iron complex transport system substrate-binding protein